MKKRTKILVIMGLGFLLSLAYFTARSQSFILDKPIGAGDLTLFPDIDNPDSYYYMPNQVQLAMHPDGKPMFSFIKYVRNTDLTSGTGTQITRSDEAGGIIHAVVRLDVTNEQIKEAERALRRIRSNGKIIGPVIYKSGTVMLVSSFNREGDNVRRVVGLGTAPILEGQNCAVSVHLAKEASDILWATFETPTPDFSISFEMEIEGFLSPKRAEIVANWDRVYSHHSFQAALASPILSAEVSAAFDDLRDQGAIKITQIGSDEQMDKLIETAYNQLANLMLDKIAGSGIPDVKSLFPGNDKSMLDRATENLQKSRKEAMDYNTKQEQLYNERLKHENQARTGARSARDSIARARGTEVVRPAAQTGRSERPAGDQETRSPDRMSIPSLSIALSYKMKKEKRSGEYKLNLNKYTKETRMNRFDQNFGSLISLSSCPDCFRRVNLDDPLYQQREINARVDGSINSDDFGKYINSVEVLIRKTHQNGQQTVQGVQINKQLFNDRANNFVIIYGWKGDDDRNKWLSYEYKTRWSYFGGAATETDWTKTESAALALAPDYVRKPVYVEADGDFFEKENIRAAEVTLYYNINGKEQTRRVTLQPKDKGLSQMEELVLPRDSNEYEYDIAYFVRGQGAPKVIPRQKTSYGRIYLETLN
ncbi:MAG: hypothetical protein MUE37_08290 [Bacteroidales bacterium]|jgi:hypothetical protein|nr:hypothetical protein [Bacteroidales bacterium]